jgi:predicted Zn finger-like uncharacterized protein/prepilin-type processing-associated H-X9-DG protein
METGDPTSTATHTQCPHCGFAYTVTPEQSAGMAGRSFACTNCGQPFTLSPSGAAFVLPAVQHVSYASGADAKSNPLAIASLICGCLLCIPFLPGIASIVCGAIGMRKTRDPAVGGKGLAIAGLVLGVLNVLGWGAYLGLIFAVMAPSLGGARQAANQVKCASNLRQIGIAILLYANDNQGHYPDSLDQLLLTQDITAPVFVCPSSKDSTATGATTQAIATNLNTGGHLSYVYVGKGLTNSAGPTTIVAYEPLSNHANTGSNVLYGDGSVRFVSQPQAGQIIQQLQAGQNPPGASDPTTTAPASVEGEAR